MSQENKINISFPQEKYKYLLVTLESFKNGIRMLGINELYKKSLIKDIHTIESIIKTNKKEVNL